MEPARAPTLLLRISAFVLFIASASFAGYEEEFAVGTAALKDGRASDAIASFERLADQGVRTGTGTGQHAPDVQLLFGRAVVEVELNTRGVRRLLDASGEGGAISGAGRIVHFELAAQHREALGHT